MGITGGGLMELGFIPEEDFVLFDDGDGTYIKEWKSSKPQPSVAEIEAADKIFYQKIDEANAIRESIKQTVATKIGRTVAELDEMSAVEIVYYLTEGK